MTPLQQHEPPHLGSITWEPAPRPAGPDNISIRRTDAGQAEINGVPYGPGVYQINGRIYTVTPTSITATQAAPESGMAPTHQYPPLPFSDRILLAFMFAFCAPWLWLGYGLRRLVGARQRSSIAPGTPDVAVEWAEAAHYFNWYGPWILVLSGCLIYATAIIAYYLSWPMGRN